MATSHFQITLHTRHSPAKTIPNIALLWPVKPPYAVKFGPFPRPIAATATILAFNFLYPKLCSQVDCQAIAASFAMIALQTLSLHTSSCSTFLAPPFIHLQASHSNSTCIESTLSLQPYWTTITVASASLSSSSTPASPSPSHLTGLPADITSTRQIKLRSRPCPSKRSRVFPHDRLKARLRAHAQIPHTFSHPSRRAGVTSYHPTDTAPLQVSAAIIPPATTTSTSATPSTPQSSPSAPSSPAISLPVSPPPPDSVTSLPLYHVENEDTWPLCTLVAPTVEDPLVVCPETVLNSERLQQPFWRALTRSGRHLRLLLLGSAALRREANNARKYAYTPYTVALSRGIVIFADYLADLLVLDLVQDGLRHPCPPLAIAAIAAGAVSGIAAGDALTGIAAWLSKCYFPSGFFNFFPTSLPIKSNTKQKSESRKVIHINNSSDIFVQLQNSCFLCTPALTVATSVAHEGAELSMSVLPTAEIASTAIGVSTSGATTATTTVMTTMMIDSMEMLTITLYLQTAIAVTLSLCALAPILRPSPSRPDTAVIRLLRNARLLKQHEDHGWAQTSGVADAVLNVVLPVVENLLVRGSHILQRLNPKN